MSEPRQDWRHHRTTDLELQLWRALDSDSASAVAARFGLSERQVVRLRGVKKRGTPKRIVRLQWWQSNRNRILAILGRQSGWDTIIRKVTRTIELFANSNRLRNFLIIRLAMDNIDIPGQKGDMPEGWVRKHYLRRLESRRITGRKLTKQATEVVDKEALGGAST